MTTPQFMQVNINLIDPNPFQPRRYFDQYQHAALVQDVRERGVLQPVELVSCKERYMLNFGHRRLQAAKEAGLDTIPALIVSSAGNSLEIALVENLLRVNLNVLEKAEAFDQLVRHGCTQKKLSAIAGLSSPSVNEILNIMRIPSSIREECNQRGHLTQKFLVKLSRYGSSDDMREAYQYFLENGKLPPKKTRKYGDEITPHRVLLTSIKEVVTQLRDKIDLSYAAESPLQEELEREIAELLEVLSRKGWFIPKRLSEKFDPPNNERTPLHGN